MPKKWHDYAIKYVEEKKRHCKVMTTAALGLG
jgi:hypothetical protein